MKFHSIHGNNVVIDEGGSRAFRNNSFCDGITFSHKPLTVNSRISILLGSNEEWTGALRIGVTSQDPANLAKKLPRFVCPDLTSKEGFWARPVPESWASDGNRLTFYVNSLGHFHLFVNTEHKGAILVGLPVKEQLWVILDLYGITVSIKFVPSVSIAPAEIVARGPEALKAYHKALSGGSVSRYQTRLALIGPPGCEKTSLKRLLISDFLGKAPENLGIDSTLICQSSADCEGRPWTLVKSNALPSQNKTECLGNDLNAIGESEDSADCSEIHEEKTVTQNEDEYFRAIAANIVREMLSQKKKKKEERRMTPLSRSAMRLHSSLSKIAPSSKASSKDGNGGNKECIETSFINEGMLDDIPSQIVELVETMLKDVENKQDWDKRGTEKNNLGNSVITFHIWDYSGYANYLILHQLFLSPQTIYLLIFDLSKELHADIEASADKCGFELTDVSEFSTLSFIDMWLEIIYAIMSHSSSDDNQNTIPDNTAVLPSLLPPVIIVGTHKDCTSMNDELRKKLPIASVSQPQNKAQVEHQFNRIKESLQDKAYYHHVIPTFYVIGLENCEVNNAAQSLRKKIEALAIQQPHVGMEVPLKWILFEQAIDRLIERGVFFADINKLSEVARLEDIDPDHEFHSVVHFLHHQGKIWHLKSDLLDHKKCNGLIILKPQWFISYVYQLFSKSKIGLIKSPKHGDPNLLDSKKAEPDENGIVPYEYFEQIYPHPFHHLNIMLGILHTVDIISDEISNNEISDDSSKLYFVPWILQVKSNTDTVKLTFNGMVLVIEFSGLLPAGFLTRLLIRLYGWCEQHSWKRKPRSAYGGVVIAVDYNHDIIISKLPSQYSRIKVNLIQKSKENSDDDSDVSEPLPHVCTKVYQLLETELEYLQKSWYKRILFSFCVPCPCEKVCDAHSFTHCMEDECLHLLPLKQCLSKKIVECDYRQVKTNFIQKYLCGSSFKDFPESTVISPLASSNLATPVISRSFWGDHDVSGDDVQWFRGAGKMLSSGQTGRDWIALAKRLGYSEREIANFEDDIHPELTLLNNWLESNGRTRYCIDLLVSCLEQMGRLDVAERIQTEIGPELPAPPVFISYQWDSQESVLHLRRRLEFAGFPCWMDVGQLGGGDTLYGRIYEGISKAKVFLCCLTPRYALSPTCSREASLADVLRKPIVPVMMEPTPWPPPGPLAVILSSLVYIDLCSIGGHGGCGRQADWESKFQNIMERLAHYISPAFASYHLNEASASRLIAPPDTLCKNHGDFANAAANTAIRDNHVDVTTGEEDNSSVSSSTREQRSSTPITWERSHSINRVVRCTICVVI